MARNIAQGEMYTAMATAMYKAKEKNGRKMTCDLMRHDRGLGHRSAQSVLHQAVPFQALLPVEVKLCHDDVWLCDVGVVTDGRF